MLPLPLIVTFSDFAGVFIIASRLFSQLLEKNRMKSVLEPQSNLVRDEYVVVEVESLKGICEV